MSEELNQKAKTKGQITFDILSYLLGLQNYPDGWTDEIDVKFHNENQEKWVPLADAEAEIELLEKALAKMREENKNLRENWDGYQAREEEIEKLRSELANTTETLMEAEKSIGKLGRSLVEVSQREKLLEGRIAEANKILKHILEREWLTAEDIHREFEGIEDYNHWANKRFVYVEKLERLRGLVEGGRDKKK